MSLLKQKPIILENCCNAIFDESIVIDAILWYSSKPVQSIKKVFLQGKYAAVSIGKSKIHVHRLLGCYMTKSLLDKDIHVHHKDGNKLNNELTNLEIVNGAKHLSSHNKGKPISQSTREAIRRFNFSRKGKRAKPKRPDVSPEMVYVLYHKGMSINAISKHLQMDWGCVKSRLNDFVHDNPELQKLFEQ